MNREDQPQTLIGHLLELRSRLLRCILVIVALFLALFYFARDIYAFVAQPLMRALPEGTSMIATDVTAPFMVPFKLTLYLSVLLAVPFILHQAWGFIAPGLYRHERRLAFPLLVSSVLLFYGGASFAYFIVFPLIFGFFTSIAPEGVAIATDIGSYLDFVMTLFIAFGASFELPIAIVLLVASGITTVDSLKAKRPYIIVGCFVAGMLLTPPDVLSQALLAVPMWLLFEIGLLVARWVKPRECEAGDGNNQPAGSGSD
ncbi:twin-arginine translocase subunit TatC [Alcanivorax quisquiliarum]|uniref:Sec-independent protein translocase protein TatC n=1 Tax=Alcanivorax quisquiliarum TaxID=2933565 RepID=A0ABT0E5R3_9GAMM|nr:twin-arginine translocase subunit TatC [Alcanivorax quisquiliarum]MCK0537170.1 twin-arginine translocase subunit TatC [Alcanivorax quisquiliarum]